MHIKCNRMLKYRIVVSQMVSYGSVLMTALNNSEIKPNFTNKDGSACLGIAVGYVQF
jgi:hypothetical protein